MVVGVGGLSHQALETGVAVVPQRVQIALAWVQIARAALAQADLPYLLEEPVVEAY
jgi:hypothetical protein